MFLRCFIVFLFVSPFIVLFSFSVNFFSVLSIEQLHVAYFCVGMKTQIWNTLVSARVASFKGSLISKFIVLLSGEKMRSDVISSRIRATDQMLSTNARWTFQLKDENLMEKITNTVSREKKKRTTQILKVTFDHNYLHGLRQTDT